MRVLDNTYNAAAQAEMLLNQVHTAIELPEDVLGEHAWHLVNGGGRSQKRLGEHLDHVLHGTFPPQEAADGVRGG